MRRAITLLALLACKSERPPTPSEPAPVVTPIDATALDAAPGVAGPRALTPIDPATLPEVTVTALPDDPGGPPTDVFAANADAMMLLRILREREQWVVAAVKSAPFTGRLHAPSRRAAFETIRRAAGIDLGRAPRGATGTTVDLDFSDADAHDILRALSDVGRVNLVAPGALPPLDLRVVRQPWDAVLAQIAAVAGRRVEKVGGTWYLLDPAQQLPALPALSKQPALSLHVARGEARDAFALLRHLVGVSIDRCGGTPFTLRLQRVSPAEAARAVGVMANVLTPAPCPPVTVATAFELGDRVAAIGGAGADRAAIAIRSTGPVLITKQLPGIRFLGDSELAFDQTVVRLRAPPAPPAPVDPAIRTSALITIGDQQLAIVSSSSVHLRVELPGDPALALPFAP